MKLYGVTTSYNCEELVPYVMKYYSEMGYDKLIVYDNESTDNTVELLKQYPFVEIRTFPHTSFAIATKLKDGNSTIIADENFKANLIMKAVWDIHKNEIGTYEAKKTEPVWITICDFDEVIFFSSIHGITFKYYLNQITKNNYNVCYEQMLWIFGTKNSYDKNEFLHRQVEKCAYGEGYFWKKPLLFRLDNLKSLKLAIGQHSADFEFIGQEVKPLTNTRSFHVFHLKYAVGNPKHLWCNVIPNYRDEAIKNAIRIDAYFEYKMLNGVDWGE